MKHMGILLIYFLIGLLHDSLVTIWYMALESRKTLFTGFISALLTFIGYGVLAFMILSPEFIPRLFSYALGTWTGTSIAIHLKYKRGVRSEVE
jgi:hypothetical protein